MLDPLISHAPRDGEGCHRSGELKFELQWHFRRAVVARQAPHDRGLLALFGPMPRQIAPRAARNLIVAADRLGADFDATEQISGGKGMPDVLRL